MSEGGLRLCFGNLSSSSSGPSVFSNLSLLAHCQCGCGFSCCFCHSGGRGGRQFGGGGGGGAGNRTNFRIVVENLSSRISWQVRYHNRLLLCIGRSSVWHILYVFVSTCVFLFNFWKMVVSLLIVLICFSGDVLCAYLDLEITMCVCVCERERERERERDWASKWVSVLQNNNQLFCPLWNSWFVWRNCNVALDLSPGNWHLVSGMVALSGGVSLRSVICWWFGHTLRAFINWFDRHRPETGKKTISEKLGHTLSGQRARVVMAGWAGNQTCSMPTPQSFVYRQVGSNSYQAPVLWNSAEWRWSTNSLGGTA